MNEDHKIYIPPNKYVGIGYYTINEFVELLRLNKRRPSVIQFLADMLEE